jgi:glycine/D-amino acid oxidase-like deaminating enzyme
MMVDTPLWTDGSPYSFPPLSSHFATEIVVVGAGVAGLTAAYELSSRGYQVAVLDKNAPGSGMTGRSTSHIANAIDDGWRKLTKAIGNKRTPLVAQAYAAGIERVAEIVAAEKILCDFVRLDGYLRGKPSQRLVLAAERDAATRAGIRGVAWSDLDPFGEAGPGLTLRFPGQARLHPLKYVNGLVEAIVHRGGRFHRAEVLRVASHHKPLHVETQHGGITATRAVVLADNSSLKFGSSAPLQERYRTYVLAASYPKGMAPDTVCWDLETPYHYSRLQPGERDDTLIVGGEDHEASRNVGAAARFARLEAWARRRFPALRAVTARWTGEIKQTTDNLAFLGRNAAESDVFVIDGDGGLGFNHATVGALIIADLIDGRNNPWVDIFDPQRYGPATHALTMAENATQVASLWGT